VLAGGGGADPPSCWSCGCPRGYVYTVVRTLTSFRSHCSACTRTIVSALGLEHHKHFLRSSCAARYYQSPRYFVAATLDLGSLCCCAGEPAGRYWTGQRKTLCACVSPYLSLNKRPTTRLDRRSGGVLSLGECGDRNGNPSHNFTRRTQPRAVAEVAEVPQLIAPGLVVHIGGLAATNLWLAEAQNRLIKVGVTWPAGSYTSPNETHSVLGPSVLGTVFFYCSSLQTAGLS